MNMLPGQSDKEARHEFPSRKAISASLFKCYVSLDILLLPLANVYSLYKGGGGKLTNHKSMFLPQKEKEKLAGLQEMPLT